MNGWMDSFITIFKCRGIDLRTGRSGSGSVERLDHHAVLSKLLQVIQCVHLTVPCGFHLHYTVLSITARSILPITDLIATDHSILELFLRSLGGVKRKDVNLKL